MKKLACMLLACSVSCGTALAQNVEDVLTNYMKAWEQHDVDKISSFFDADVVWFDLASDSTTKGKAEVSKAITDTFMGYVPNMFWVKTGDYFVSGNTAIYEWTYGGTFNGSWGSRSIKNKDFSIKGLSTTTISDQGKIVAQKDYYDMDSFQRALGVKP